MAEITYDDLLHPVRDDIVAAQNRCWQGLARAGTWYDGATKIAIAAETRNARDCPHCAAQKAALSPNAVEGAHTGLGELRAVDVDAIHRIASDPARVPLLLDQGLTALSVAPAAVSQIKLAVSRYHKAG